MIGLEYILEVYGVQQADLAEQLGIKPQNITLWFRGKQNISKKYLPILSEKFNIPVEYFQKELTNIDKRKIDLRHAEMIVAEMHNDSNAVENYRMRKAELKEAKVLNKVRSVINDISEPDEMDDYIRVYEENIEIFDRFIKVVKGFKNKKEVLQPLLAMEKFNSKDTELKKKLLSAAEQHISKEMVKEFSLVEVMCAVMLLYEKKEAELWKEFEK